jgi:hypothetical protein
MNKNCILFSLSAVFTFFASNTVSALPNDTAVVVNHETAGPALIKDSIIPGIEPSPGSIHGNPGRYILVGSNKDTDRAIVRKKAEVDRNSLLVQQEAGEISLKSGEDDVRVDYSGLLSINEGTLLGIGGYKLRDTYLS